VPIGFNRLPKLCLSFIFILVLTPLLCADPRELESDFEGGKMLSFSISTNSEEPVKQGDSLYTAYKTLVYECVLQKWNIINHRFFKELKRNTISEGVVVFSCRISKTGNVEKITFEKETVQNQEFITFLSDVIGTIDIGSLATGISSLKFTHKFVFVTPYYIQSSKFSAGLFALSLLAAITLSVILIVKSN